MAEPEDYSAALEGLLAGLRASAFGAENLSWLADNIERELEFAEAQARETRDASLPDVVTELEAVLSDQDRLEIALHVMYHHLVSVPRMWAHVQGFWRTQAHAGVVLLDTASQRAFDLDERTALDTASTALAAIRNLVEELSELYELTLPIGWLQASEDDHGQ